METPLPDFEASSLHDIVLTNLHIAELKLGNLCIKDLDARRLIISKISLEIDNYASPRMADDDSFSTSTEETVREKDRETPTPTRGSSSKAAADVFFKGLRDGTAKEFTPKKKAYVEEEPEAEQVEVESALVSPTRNAEGVAGYIAPHIRARSRNSQNTDLD